MIDVPVPRQRIQRTAVEAHFDASGALCAQAVGSAPDGGTGDVPPSDRQAILNEAWIYAVHGGHSDTADYLLDRSAQIDAIEPYGLDAHARERAALCRSAR